ncbi:MAG: cyclic nucleotide-binding domain-containing protein [candidate division Zixibacteria bacterium]|nr:cyclic nucleotide-binding domain-containing protein [candidate division Zixibacteria bacterium]
MKDFGTLGKSYADGELIVKQGDSADEFYVLQEGKIEIFQTIDGTDILLAVCSQGEIVGEWMPEDKNCHSVSVRAKGRSRVMTIHRHLLLKRIHEDPTLAFRLLEMLSRRLQETSQRLVRSKVGPQDN